MSLATVQAAVVSALATEFPTLTVEAHGGTFTEREVPLLLARAPLLLVSCLGVDRMTPFGATAWRIQTRWAIYVFGADTVTTDRDVLALDAVAALLVWLPDQRWGLTAAELPDPESFAADNLYTGHVNILQVSLWAVTWTQTLILSPE